METIAKILRKAAFWRMNCRGGQKEPGEEYRVMLENAVQGIMLLQDGRVRYANARARFFFDTPMEELTLESLASRIHPDDRAMALDRYARRLRGEEMPEVSSFRVLARDGRVLWLKFSVSLIEREGRPAILVLAEDITERKKMEAGLADSQKTIRAILDASPAVEFLLAPDGKVLGYNKKFERFFGGDGKPLIGRDIKDLIPPEEDQVNRGKLLEVLSTGKPVSFEDYQQGMWLEKRFEPILDEEGRVAKIACYGKDVSEKKRAADALKENELRYRLLAENVSDYFWSTDRNLGLTYVSPGVTRLLGYTPEELMAKKLEDQMTPDSVTLVRKLYAQEMAKEKKGTKEQPQPQVLVAEYRRKDGSTFWAEIRVNPVFDSEGEIVSIVGMTHDISDRKKAEEELRESERRYRLLAENATDVIWATDLNLRLIYVSPSVARLRGYTPEEVMAEPLEKAYSPDSWALIQKVYAEELGQEGKNTGDLTRTRTLELEHTCKDGSTIWAESKISAIRDAEGKIVELIGVTRDISERKKAEQALRESEKTVRALLDGIPAAEILIDTQGTVLATNRTFDRIYEKDGKPLVGRDLRDLIAPQEYEFSLPKVNEVARTGNPIFFDDPQRGRWLEKAFYPILDEKGQVTKIACYGRDISERKRAEEALRRSEEGARRLADENAVMAEITRIMSSSLNIEEVYERFAGEVRKLIEFENLNINLVNPGKRSVTKTYASGKPIPGREVGAITPLEGTATEEVLKTRSSLFIHKENLEEMVRKFPKVRPWVEAGIHSMIIVPLISEGEIIGILSFLSSRPDAYTRADVEIAEKVATQIAGAIGKAQIFQELQRMVEALRESELRNRNLVEAAGISGLGIVVFKGDKPKKVVCLFANEEAQKITGYTEEELSRIPFLEIIHPAHREAASNRYWTRVGGAEEPVLYRLVVRHKKGHTVLIEVSAIHTVFRGEDCMIGFFRDITERRRTEEALQESEAKFRELFHNANDLIFLHRMIDDRTPGQFIEVNDLACRKLGYTREELLRLSPQDINVDFERVDSSILQKIEVREKETDGRLFPLTFEAILAAKDGKLLSVEISFEVFTLKGQKMALAIARDISERKKSEEALRRSEQGARRLAKENAVMAEVSRIISSSLKIEEVYELFAEEVKKLIGFENLNVSLMNPEKRSVTKTYVFGNPIPGREVGALLPLEGMAAEEVLKTRSSLFIHKENLEEAVRKFPKLRPWIEAGFQSVIIVPLISEGGIIGVLNFLSSRPDAYTRADVEIAEKVAAHIAGAIARAQIFQELQRTLEALQESELRNRSLVEAAGISGLGIVVFQADKRRRVFCLFANEEAQKITGYSAEELRRTPFQEIVHPAHRETALNQYLAMAAGDQDPVLYYLVLRHKKGHTVLIEISAIHTVFQGEDCMIGFFRNISKRRRTEEALQESEAKFRELFNNANDLIFLHGVDDDLRPGKFLEINDMACRKLGYTREELLNLSPPEISLDFGRLARRIDQDFAARMKDSGDSAHITFEDTFAAKDGGILSVEVSLVIYTLKGVRIGLSIARDITDRKKAEEELIHYQAHLEEMVRDRTARIQELEQQRGEIEKMAATGVLAARIAHEINNPLAGIKGSFMLIQDAIPPDHPYHHYIGRIHGEINRIARIVRQMFELYRSPEGEQEEWGMDQMVQDIVALLKDEAHERKVSFQLPVLPVKVRVPAGPIRQVLFNVIKNAVEASPAEGQVKVSVEGGEKEIRIKVVDEGPGIPEKSRPHVFKPFFSTKKGRQKGLGLGLSISKEIVESLGGSIRLQNLHGGGLLCQIDLPKSKPEKGNTDD